MGISSPISHNIPKFTKKSCFAINLEILFMFGCKNKTFCPFEYFFALFLHCTVVTSFLFNFTFISFGNCENNPKPLLSSLWEKRKKKLGSRNCVFIEIQRSIAKLLNVFVSNASIILNEYAIAVCRLEKIWPAFCSNSKISLSHRYLWHWCHNYNGLEPKSTNSSRKLCKKHLYFCVLWKIHLGQMNLQFRMHFFISTKFISSYEKWRQWN